MKTLLVKRIPKDTFLAFKAKCAVNGTDMSAVIRDFIEATAKTNITTARKKTVNVLKSGTSGRKR